MDDECDLDMQLDEYPEILNYSNLYFPSKPSRILNDISGNSINYMKINVCMKVFSTIATFNLFNGEYDKSLNIYYCNLHMSHLFIYSNLQIAREIGYNYSKIAVKDILFYIINVKLEEKQYLSLIKYIDREITIDSMNRYNIQINYNFIKVYGGFITS